MPHFGRREDIGWRRTACYLAWVLAMAFVFASVEVQVEGDAGWADALILLVRRLPR